MAATVATPLERALGRIAGVTEMTSSSSLGATQVILQFDLNRNIDGAARDVQSAINAARSTLPTMPSNPAYRKVNPAGAPIMILSITSDVLTRSQLYDAASTVLAQKISQLAGVGEVIVGGGALACGARGGHTRRPQQGGPEHGGRAQALPQPMPICPRGRLKATPTTGW